MESSATLAGKSEVVKADTREIFRLCSFQNEFLCTHHSKPNSEAHLVMLHPWWFLDWIIKYFYLMSYWDILFFEISNSNQKFKYLKRIQKYPQIIWFILLYFIDTCYLKIIKPLKVIHIFHVCTLNGSSQYSEKHLLGIGLDMIGEAFSHVLRMRINRWFRTSDGSAIRNSAREGRIPVFIYFFSVSTSVLWKSSLLWYPARLADVRAARGKTCWEELESHHHHFHITRGRRPHNSI